MVPFLVTPTMLAVLERLEHAYREGRPPSGFDQGDPAPAGWHGFALAKAIRGHRSTVHATLIRLVAAGWAVGVRQPDPAGYRRTRFVVTLTASGHVNAVSLLAQRGPQLDPRPAVT